MSRHLHIYHRTATALDTAGITWWLSDGTALGAIRDQDFIRTDPDIDLGVWIDDLPTARDALAPLGRLIRDRPHQFNVRIRNVKVDLHGHERDGDQVYYRLGPRSQLRYTFPARLFHHLEPVRFGQRDALVPAPPEDYLAAHYGPDWATPRTGWQWDRDPPCLRR